MVLVLTLTGALFPVSIQANPLKNVYAGIGCQYSSTDGTAKAEPVQSGGFLKAQFQYPLGSRFAATWHAGVMRAEFEADGSLAVIPLPLPLPRPVPLPDPLRVPFADPGRETGYFFGFGALWRAHRHLDVELSYSRKDLEVLEFDSVGVRLIGRL